ISAVAAAEIIAAARGQESSQLSNELRQWITDQSFLPQQSLTKAAAAVVRRIRDASELRDEWNDDPAWLAEMDRLYKRLMRLMPSSTSAARPDTRKKVVQKSDGSPPTIHALMDKLGYRVIWDEMNERLEPRSAMANSVLKDKDLAIIAQISS